ncbi:C4-type zinc finger protein, DksA/TraR family protein [Minicystis rosea]|nr:C4-type zinc finger protein, DksA/TraR family protein [Minicystis rosea]
MSEAMNSRRRASAPAEPARTAARAPTAPARPPVPVPPPRRPSGPEQEGPAELTEAQVEELRAMLEERRAQLLESIDARREQERDTGREVGDEMDEANTEGVTAMTSKLLERDVALLREIEHALEKMAHNTYGACEGTGEPIGYARLKLRPWARFSVAHQEEMEREARSRGGV